MRHSLATILALARVAAAETADRAVQGRLDSMVREANHALALTAPPHASDVADVDLASVASDVAAAAEVVHGVTISLEVASADAEIAGDATLARRAISNIVDNACRAAGRDGTVAIRIEGTAAEVVVEVADSGPGFGAAASPRRGGGFGLAIARAATLAHGGWIEIETDGGVLGGATVRFAFARHQP